MLTRTTKAIPAVAVGAMLLLAPAATAVTPMPPSFEVEEASTLTWGFKETFRSYISGSIASGNWDTSGGATYETPEFSWTGGSGVLQGDRLTGGGADFERVSGDISFAGAIHFDGHGGLLGSTLENPVLRFDGTDVAVLHLDITSLGMEDALAGNADAVVEATDVPFVTLDLGSGEFSVSDDGTAITGANIPTVITQEGFDTFGNYPEGTDFDPISFEIALSEVEPDPVPTEEATTEPAPDESGDTEEPGSAPDDEATEGATEATDDDANGGGSDLNWPLIIFGGVLGTIAGIVIVVRNKRRANDAGTGGGSE